MTFIQPDTGGADDAFEDQGCLLYIGLIAGDETALQFRAIIQIQLIENVRDGGLWRSELVVRCL